MRRSFRIRAAIIIALAFIIFLTAFFTLSYFAVRDSLLSRGDREVQEQLELIVDNIRPEHTAEQLKEIASRYGATGEAILGIMIVRHTDSTTITSGPLHALQALRRAPFTQESNVANLRHADLEYRCFKASSDDFDVFASMDMRVLEETEQSMISEFTTLLLIGTIVSALLGYIVAGYSLRPFQRLLKSARMIEAEPAPSQTRLPLTDRVPEIAELAQTMNTILNNRDASIAKLSSFSADVSHELRTPLTTMKGELEVELKLSATGEQRDILTSLLEEVERLIAIVEDLLLLSEIEQEETERNTHAPHASLESTIRSLAARSSRLAAERSVTFTVEDSLPSAIELSMPALRLERMLFNVILNAITFTPASGKVRLSIDQTANAIIIKVADTGKGIPTDDLRHIFDRFWRAEHSRSRSLGGAGLGLAITKSIADHYGISVHIESPQSQGTIVSFTFPSQLIV